MTILAKKLEGNGGERSTGIIDVQRAGLARPGTGLCQARHGKARRAAGPGRSSPSCLTDGLGTALSGHFPCQAGPESTACEPYWASPRHEKQEAGEQEARRRSAARSRLPTCRARGRRWRRVEEPVARGLEESGRSQRPLLLDVGV